MVKSIRFEELVSSLKKLSGANVEREVVHTGGVYREYVLSFRGKRIFIEFLEFNSVQVPMKFCVLNEENEPMYFYSVNEFLSYMDLQLDCLA